MSDLEKWYNNVHSISISITSCITSNHISINIYLRKRKNDTVLNYVGALAHLCAINRPWNKGFTRKKLLDKLWKLGMAISFERVTQLITLDIKGQSTTTTTISPGADFCYYFENEIMEVLIIHHFHPIITT